MGNLMSSSIDALIGSVLVGWDGDDQGKKSYGVGDMLADTLLPECLADQLTLDQPATNSNQPVRK
jgi:hypothetical protein